MLKGIENFAKVGSVLTCWDERPYVNIYDGSKYEVSYVSPTAEKWPGTHYEVYFVGTKRIKKNGKAGKRVRYFLVSEDGSVKPLR